MARQLRRDARGRFSSTGTVRNRRPETAASKPTKASKAAAGPAKAAGSPKTTTARGRALTRQREVNRQLKAERKGGGVASVKTARSAAVAARAREYYAATGTGTKRSPTRTRTSASTSGATKAADLVAKPAKGGGKPARSTQQASPSTQPIKTSKSEEKRKIVSELKRSVVSKNIQATRILQRMAAKDGHGGDVGHLTKSKSRGERGWTVDPLRLQRGNQYSAEKEKDLMFNRGPSRELINAAHDAVIAGRVSEKRFRAVLKASGRDYFSSHNTYFDAIAKAKSKLYRINHAIPSTQQASPAATKPARTSKAPASAAKTRYRELTSNARRERNNRDATPRTAGAAKAAVTRFEGTRGVKGGKKRPVAASAAAAKPARTRKAAAPAPATPKPAAKPRQASPAAAAPARSNPRAERARRIKETVNRSGIVPGSRFESGQAQRTLSMAEMRSAVRKDARARGVKTQTEFNFMFSQLGGVTRLNAQGLREGRTPRTRSDWERIYRATQGVPQSEQGRRGGPGIVRGIDIHTNWRPRYVFGLQPGASTADINRAYRGLAKQLHPDAGGRAKDMARITAMRDTLLALQPKPKPKPARGGKRGKAAAPAPAPRGPLALPPARGGAMAPAGGGKPASKPARKPRPKKR